nr:MAG TPA: hypothetical protein [Caudoviricetes sp.]
MQLLYDCVIIALSLFPKKQIYFNVIRGNMQRIYG